MPTIAISKIVVQDRQRKDLGDLEGLKKSFENVGIIHPVVIDDMNNLIVGERRLTAATELGMEEIEYRRLEGLDEVEKQKLELEENLHRKDLDPQEKLEALERLHTLLSGDSSATTSRGIDTTGDRWTQGDTAKLLGRSQSQVSEELTIAKAMSLLPDNVKKRIYDKAGDSVQAVKRELDQAVKRAVRSIDAEQRSQEQIDRQKAETPENAPKRNPNLDYHQQFRFADCFGDNGFASVEDESVDLIITDPPYGSLEDSVFDKRYGQTSTTDREFGDHAGDISDVLRKAIPHMYRVLVPDSHVYLFCSLVSKDFKRTLEIPCFASIAVWMEEAGFKVRPAPLIWYKSGVQGIAGGNQQWPFNYEAILFARKGSKVIEKVPRSDVLSAQPLSGGNKLHKTQKPYALLSQLTQASGLKDGLLLDPFAGSGASLLAGLRANMRVLGFELHQDTAVMCRELMLKRGSLDAEAFAEYADNGRV